MGHSPVYVQSEWQHTRSVIDTTGYDHDHHLPPAWAFCPIIHLFVDLHCLAVWCPWSRPHAIPNVKSRLPTQQPGSGTTRSRHCPHCDELAQQSGIGPGSSASRRYTSMPGVHPHPAPTPVRSEIECFNTLSTTPTQQLGPNTTSCRGPPPPVATRPLNSQAPALARQLQADGLAYPRFIFTLFPLLCTQRSSASMHRAPRLAQLKGSFHRRLSYHHLHHQAAQVMSHL